jgi:hypothetical protein
VFETVSDRGLVLGAPAAKARLELRESGREHENGHRVARIPLANLARPLDVDVEHDVPAACDRVVKRMARCAVGGVEHVRRFGKLAPFEAPFELVFGHEVIVNSVNFAIARGTRGQ